MGRHAVLAAAMAVALLPLPSRAATDHAADADIVRRLPLNTKMASGTLIDADGHVITAGLLVANCRTILVGNETSKLTEATLVAADIRTGLALLDQPALRGSPFVWLSPASTTLQPVQTATADIDVATMPRIRSGALEIKSLRTGSSPGATIWAAGDTLRGTEAGAPVFEPTTGRVTGIVEAVYPSSASADMFHQDKPLLLAAGAPIEHLFLQDIAERVHAKLDERSGKLTAADAEAATAMVMCLR